MNDRETQRAWMVAFWEAAACCVMAAIFGGVALMLALKRSHFRLPAGRRCVGLCCRHGHEFWRVCRRYGALSVRWSRAQWPIAWERESCVWWYYLGRLRRQRGSLPQRSHYWGGEQ